MKRHWRTAIGPVFKIDLSQFTDRYSCVISYNFIRILSGFLKKQINRLMVLPKTSAF